MLTTNYDCLNTWFFNHGDCITDYDCLNTLLVRYKLQNDMIKSNRD